MPRLWCEKEAPACTQLDWRIPAVAAVYLHCKNKKEKPKKVISASPEGEAVKDNLVFGLPTF